MKYFFTFIALLSFNFLSSAASAAESKTFVYCSEGSPSTFNPQLATDGPTFNASSRMLYDRLVEFEVGGTKVVPGLAESWTISKDGKTFTFKLRKGVKFHSNELFTPTRDFNADDILFSFNRMRDKTHSYHMVNGGSYEYFSSMDMGKTIKNISKFDDSTVKFELSQPDAPFLANLAMDFASIISAEYGQVLEQKKMKDKIDTMPIGTGPFIFKRYVKDNSIRYESNKNYYLGSSKLDKVVFSITTDASVRFQKLKTGECHLVAEPAPADIQNMRTLKNVKVVEGAGLNVGYIAMNVEKKPFSDAKVRQAINHALNKSSYIQAIYLGNAQTAKNPIPPTMWGFNDKIQGYEFNTEKAKKLLADAGFPNGFETELWTLPVSRPYNPNGKKMGELIQADLAKIGIKVKLVTYDWPTYLDKSRKGEHQMIQLGWTGDNGDPDNFLNVLLGCSAVKAGSNVSRWCDKNFQNLVEKGKTTADSGQRTEFYKKAQEIFNKEAPWIPIAHAEVFKAMSKNVEGYKLSPFGTEHLYSVDLK